MLQNIGDRITQQTNNAVKAQEKYNNYEKQYFRELNELRTKMEKDSVIEKVGNIFTSEPKRKTMF